MDYNHFHPLTENPPPKNQSMAHQQSTATVGGSVGLLPQPSPACVQQNPVHQKPVQPAPIQIQEATASVQHAHTQGVEAFQDVVCGSAAGVIGKYIEFPFDTVKVRLQSQPNRLPLLYNGPLDCFRKSLKQDGLYGLYRGISAPLVGAAVETTCLFLSVRI